YYYWVVADGGDLPAIGIVFAAGPATTQSVDPDGANDKTKDTVKVKDASYVVDPKPILPITWHPKYKVGYVMDTANQNLTIIQYVDSTIELTLTGGQKITLRYHTEELSALNANNGWTDESDFFQAVDSMIRATINAINAQHSAARITDGTV